MKKDLKSDITRFMKRLLALGFITGTMFATGCNMDPDPKDPIEDKYLVTIPVSSEEDNIKDYPVIFYTDGLKVSERNALKQILESRFADELHDGTVYTLDFRNITAFELSTRINEGYNNLVGLFIDDNGKTNGHIVYLNVADILKKDGQTAFNDIMTSVDNQFGAHNGGVPSPNLSKEWRNPPEQLHERGTTNARAAMFAGMIPANTR